MAGRPEMKIGKFGKITRTQLPDGRWEAVCRYKGPDGVVRRAKRVSPVGERDRNGAKAEAQLLTALEELTTVTALAARAGAAQLSEVLLREILPSMRANSRKYSSRTMDSYNRAARILTETHKRRDGTVCKTGHLGSLRANEVTVRDFRVLLEGIWEAHDRTAAKQARTLLMSVGTYLVECEVWETNKVREIVLDGEKGQPKSPTALNLSEARELLEKLRTSDEPLPTTGTGRSGAVRTVSEYVQSLDLLDPVTVAIFIGLRRGELLGVVWDDYDSEAETLTVRHHVIRAGARDGSGKTELIHEAATKTDSSARVIKLPTTVVELLERRRGEYERGERVRRKDEPDAIFLNSVGARRDPDGFNKQWTRVRGVIGYPDLNLHGLRKTTASILEELGYPMSVISDILGHSQISMTQNNYIGRKRQHPDAASGLDAAFAGL